jgi:hypothetical protein
MFASLHVDGHHAVCCCVEGAERSEPRGSMGWLDAVAEYAALVAGIIWHPDEGVHGCEPAAMAQRRIVRTFDALAAAHAGCTLADISHLAATTHGIMV